MYARNRPRFSVFGAHLRARFAGATLAAGATGGSAESLTGFLHQSCGELIVGDRGVWASKRRIAVL